jgi:Holliday junction DNA helicase RuvA
MIAHLQGKLVEKTPTHVIIDCGGIGYHVNISLHTYSLLPNGDFIMFTHLQIKKMHILDLLKSQKRDFKLLLSVSGIGANSQNNVIFIRSKQITNAIASADVVTIQSIKGIG